MAAGAPGRRLRSGRPARGDGGRGAPRRARRRAAGGGARPAPRRSRRSASGCAPRAWRGPPSSRGSARRARRSRSTGRRRHERARPGSTRADRAERGAQGRWSRRRGSPPSSLVIVAARVLGPVEFGKFTFGYALATMLGVALEFGVTPVLTRAVARDPAATAEPVGGGGDPEARAPGPGGAGLPGPAAPRAPPVGHDGGGVAPRPGASRSRRSWRTGWPSSPASSGSSRSCGCASWRRACSSSRASRRSRWAGGLLGVAFAFVLAAAVSLGLTTRLIHRRLARLDGWWNAAGARALARELAPVAQALFLASPPRAWRRWSWRCSPATWPPGTSARPSASTTSCRSCPSRWSRPSTRSWRGRRPAHAALPRADHPGVRGAPPGRLAHRTRCWRRGRAPGSSPWIYGPGYAARGADPGARSAPPAAAASCSTSCGVVFLALDRPRPAARGGGARLHDQRAPDAGPGRGRRGGGRRPCACSSWSCGPGRESRGASAAWRSGRSAGAAKSLGAAAAGRAGREPPAGGAGRASWARSAPTWWRSSCCGRCRGPSAGVSCGAPSGAPARRRPGGAVVHVVLDARYIARRQSGVGAYAQRLIGGLATIDQRNRYTCLVAADGPGLPVAQANVAAWPTRVSFEDHLRGDLWLLAYLPLRLRAAPHRRLSRAGRLPAAREARLPDRGDDPRPGLLPLPRDRAQEVQPLHAPHDAAGRRGRRTASSPCRRRPRPIWSGRSACRPPRSS